MFENEENQVLKEDLIKKAKEFSEKISEALSEFSIELQVEILKNVKERTSMRYEDERQSHLKKAEELAYKIEKLNTLYK